MLLPTLGLLSTLVAMVYAKRRIILDSTQDNPSVTAILIALELSSSPSNDVELLGIITTESGELGSLQQVLAGAGLADCLPPMLAIKETELYPVYGDVLEKLPDTVQFLLDKIQEYPGEVSLYSSGSLAAYAMASQVDPTFDANLGEVGLHCPQPSFGRLMVCRARCGRQVGLPPIQLVEPH